MVSFDELKIKWGISNTEPPASGLKYSRSYHSEATGHSPSVDCFENDKEVIVVVHLPGFSRENIQLKILDYGARIKASKAFKSEETREREWHARQPEKEEPVLSEYIDFPSTANAKQAKASFKNGVLEIIVPKKY